MAKEKERGRGKTETFQSLILGRSDIQRSIIIIANICESSTMLQAVINTIYISSLNPHNNLESTNSVAILQIGKLRYGEDK